MKRFELTDEQAYCLAVAAGSFLADNPQMLVGALIEGEVDQSLVNQATRAVNSYDGRWGQGELPAVRLVLQAVIAITANEDEPSVQAGDFSADPAANDFLKRTLQ